MESQLTGSVLEAVNENIRMINPGKLKTNHSFGTIFQTGNKYSMQF